MKALKEIMIQRINDYNMPKETKESLIKRLNNRVVAKNAHTQ